MIKRFECCSSINLSRFRANSWILIISSHEISWQNLVLCIIIGRKNGTKRKCETSSCLNFLIDFNHDLTSFLPDTIYKTIVLRLLHQPLLILIEIKWVKNIPFFSPKWEMTNEEYIFLFASWLATKLFWQKNIFSRMEFN